MNKPDVDPHSPDAVEPWGPASAEAKRMGVDLAMLLRNLELTPHQRIRRNDRIIGMAHLLRRVLRLARASLRPTRDIARTALRDACDSFPRRRRALPVR